MYASAKRLFYNYSKYKLLIYSCLGCLYTKIAHLIFNLSKLRLRKNAFLRTCNAFFQLFSLFYVTFFADIKNGCIFATVNNKQTVYIGH